MGRHLVLGAATLLLLFGIARAQNVAPRTNEKAHELLVLTNAQAVGMTIMNSALTNQMEAQKKLFPQFTPEFWQKFSEIFRSEAEEKSGELTTQIEQTWMAHFSDAELDGMIQFYKTDLGRKILHETPLVAQETMKEGRVWGEKIGEDAGRRAAEGLGSKAVKQK